MSRYNLGGWHLRGYFAARAQWRELGSILVMSMKQVTRGQATQCIYSHYKPMTPAFEAAYAADPVPPLMPSRDATLMMQAVLSGVRFCCSIDLPML